ncbi:MAG: secretion protein [Planctomycetaceae bacterium]|nr:MAG: secretion protein [Planctomycetaceae bacterium]
MGGLLQQVDPIWLVSLASFLGAAALGAGIFSLTRSLSATRAEGRLELLAGTRPLEQKETSQGLLKEEMVKLGQGAMQGVLGRLANSLGQWGLFLEQADSPLTFEQLILLSGGLGIVGVGASALMHAPLPLYPFGCLLFASVPWGWLWWRRRQRFALFAKQLPDALELIARALRSGHSLNSGLHVVAEEMPAPLAYEFSLAYEQQNLGVPIEQALKGMLRRIPNTDLKFFVTAVAIQRQTGGDLAEILDKIGYVVRERFKIMGTVQALTGEGRLSGVVLMALPIAIFIAVYYLNPNYVMLLFTTELGKKMVAAGIALQVMGAVAIKKIVDIKV